MTIPPPLNDDWRSAQLRRLYRGVFHDASNPIGGALGCLQALQAGLIEDDEMDTCLDVMQGGLRQVHRLTAAFHRFVLPVEIRSTPVGLQAALDSALLLVKKTALEARVRLINEATAMTVSGGDVGCLHVAVHCLEALLDRQVAGATLRARTALVDGAVRLTFEGSTVTPPVADVPPQIVGEVERICATHGARVRWRLSEGEIVIDWPLWAA